MSDEGSGVAAGGGSVTEPEVSAVSVRAHPPLRLATSELALSISKLQIVQYGSGFLQIMRVIALGQYLRSLVCRPGLVDVRQNLVAGRNL